MKYAIIAALVSIIFVLVYSRVRPYLKLIQKVMQSFQVVDINTSTTASRRKTPSRNKLVRCDRCGTWIPAERAMSLNSGLATFCSAECMSQGAASQRKIAG
jgi:formylmethanofuran dehydrogenase subunit E